MKGLSILKYKSQRELLSFSFIKEEVNVVCPSPLIADDIRKVIPSSRKNKIQTLTINHFIKEILPRENIFSKPDLLLELSIVGKTKFKDISISHFLNSFQIFTELRSFTLDLSLAEEILEGHGKRYIQLIRWFWRYLEEKNICDEHEVYRRMIKNIYENPSHIFEQKIVLLGFIHLSGMQIDFLEALKTQADIYLPIPTEVLDEAKSSDWISWMMEKADRIIELGEINLSQENSVLRYASFPRGKMAESYLCLDTRDFDQVFLGAKNPRYAEIAEIPEEKLFFKVPSESLSIIEDYIGRDLERELFEEAHQGLSNDFFLEGLNKRINISVKKKNWRELKILSSYREIFLSWRELSNLNREVHLFDFQIIKRVVQLNLPRIYNIPCSQKELKGEIRGLDGLWSFDSKKNGIFCATSAHVSFNSDLNFYNEKAMEVLISLGPIRNASLDFNFIKFQLKEYLSLEKTLFFVEEELVENNFYWGEIWQSFDKKEEIKLNIQNQDHLESRGNNPLDQPLLINLKEKEKQQEYLSASKLQTYMDCPRKYYFSYIDRIPKKNEFFHTLNDAEIGILGHDVVGEYLNRYRIEFREDFHQKICFEKIKEFLKEKNKKINSLNLKKYCLEVEILTKETIRELQKLYALDHKAKFNFEFSLKQEKVRGNVDFFYKSLHWGIGILDFKKSKIPSEESFKEMKKIQIWFYLNHLSQPLENYAFWGYINMSKPQESLLFVKSEDIKKQLQQINFLNPNRIKNYKNLKDDLDKFKKNLNHYKKELENEVSFLPQPANQNVCKWCPVKMICPRKV